MTSKLMVLINCVGVYSPGFEASLRAFERHVKPEAREEVEFEGEIPQDKPNLEAAVDYLRNGGNVIIDSGYLPEEATLLEQMVEKEITAGKMLEEVRGRFLVTGIKVNRR